MNKNPRGILMGVIKDLKLPVNYDDLGKELEKFGDEEVRLLLVKYRLVERYFDILERKAQDWDSKRYTEIEKEYFRKALGLEKEHIQKMEEIQKESDDSLDKAEDRARVELKSIASKQKDSLDNLNIIYRQIYSKLTSAFTSYKNTSK